MPRVFGLTRVAVVDDHQLFAESVEMVLRDQGYEVDRVDVAALDVTSGALLASLLRIRAGVVLMDLDLGRGTPGLQLIEPLTRSGAAVVVVTATADRARWGECLRHGARTVLPKSGSLGSIMTTIRLIGEGRSVLAREDREELMRYYHRERQRLQESRRQLESLTAREAQVLERLMTGLVVKEIAAESVVAEGTVRSQVKQILVKLEVSSQLAAVGTAHEVRWHPPPQIVRTPRSRSAAAR